MTNRQPMRRCGKQYATRAAALAKARQRPGMHVPLNACRCGSFHVRRRPAALTVVPAQPARRTGAATGQVKAPSGFTARVRLIVRARAGHGDPDQALCERCGRPLGRTRGQFQHRDARGIGGTRNPVTNGPANAGLLCGTPATLCHGECEDRTPGTRAEGWWIPAGNGPDHDPRTVPVLLWTPGGPVRRWLSTDGAYLDTPPSLEQEAAA